jgi:adenine-specific DNA-methyltransferase
VPYVEETGTIYLIEPGFGTEQLKELLNKIGKGELLVNTIVVFPYSFTFTQILELKTNIKNNLDSNINIVERY